MKNVLKWSFVGLLAAAVLAAVIFFVPSYFSLQSEPDLQFEVPAKVQLDLAPMPQMTVGDDSNVFHPVEAIDPRPKIVDEVIEPEQTVSPEPKESEEVSSLPYAMEEDTPPPPPEIVSEVTPEPLEKKLPEPVVVKEDKRPQIAIIIDDMGLNAKLSRRAVHLPKEVTLAYLPYAHNLKQQTEEAFKDGHDLMLHFPMEPLGRQDPGPWALLNSQSVTEWERLIAKNLGSFNHFVGVNNHMGSKFTTNSMGLAFVAHALSRRGLFFVDSRTTARSVASKVMKVMKVKTATRDVFLDHVVEKNAIRKELIRAEHIARRRGSVIVIGHPHRKTLDVLEEWVAALEFNEIRLVSVKDLVK